MQSANQAFLGRSHTTLELIGLAPSAARAYRLLLRLPTASARELAASLGMSMMDVRAALQGLESKGLVGRLPGAAQRFQASPPDQALGPLVRRRHRELRTIRADVSALDHEYRDGETDDRDVRSSVELISGADAIRVQAGRLIASASVDLSIVAAGVLSTLDAVGTGVRVRAVHPRAALSRSPDRERIAQLVNAGHHARTLGRLPLDLLVVDHAVALMPVHGDGGDAPAAVIVWPGGLHDALVAAFERTWSLAAPVHVDGMALHENGDKPSLDDLRLLELLLDGLTDQAIAGRLGVGERTVQRRVRDLIDLVGVQTRLQLIWQATQRGWI